MAQAGRYVARAGPQSDPGWPVSSVMPPLGALPTAPSAARAHVRAALVTWRMSDLADALELVVSELIANGVNASAGDDGTPRYVDGRMPVVRLCLFTDGIWLVAEVWDQAPGIPTRLCATREDESGRGLDLVDKTTGSRWGCIPRGQGRASASGPPSRYQPRPTAAAHNHLTQEGNSDEQSGSRLHVRADRRRGIHRPPPSGGNPGRRRHLNRVSRRHRLGRHP